MLTQIQRSALLMHSASDMYNLVNDIGSYPQFMKGCVGTEILEQGEDYMVARLDLKAKNIGYSFTTRNRLETDRLVEMTLVEGPFKRLHGQWQFKVLTDTACKVSLDLSFEFQSLSMSIASSGLFAGVADHLLDAVVARAGKIYAVS